MHLFATRKNYTLTITIHSTIWRRLFEYTISHAHINILFAITKNYLQQKSCLMLRHTAIQRFNTRFQNRQWQTQQNRGTLYFTIGCA